MNIASRFTALVTVALVADTAFAQTTPAPAAAPAPAPFSVNVGVASSYIYRGLNQSDFKPALQIGSDYAHESGLYVGVWASSIRWIKDFGYGIAFSGGVTSTNADEMFYTPSGKKFIGRTTPYGLIKYTKSF